MSLDRFKAAIPVGLKLRVKQIKRRGEVISARVFHSHTAADVMSAVRALGVQAGDAVLMHSGFSPTSGLRSAPGELVDGMLGLLGPDGHLLMMSMAYRGSTEAYLDRASAFDVARTPSAMGLISEVFRRRESVQRSLSPAHPVLAYGPLASWLVSDQDLLEHSCGRGSTFERFLQMEGKFLFYDAPFQSLTFMHYVEDAYREQLRVPPYDPNPRTVRVVDREGRTRSVKQYVFAAEARERRNFSVVEASLRESGRLQVGRVGNSQLMVVTVADVMRAAQDHIEVLYHDG